MGTNDGEAPATHSYFDFALSMGGVAMRNCINVSQVKITLGQEA